MIKGGAGNISPSEGSNPQSVTSTIKTNNLLCSEGFEKNLDGPNPVIKKSAPDALGLMNWGNIFCLGCQSWGNLYQPATMIY